MSSPFKTFQEFSEAKGPIYTFANNPAVIGVLIILTALIVLYFLYKSYTMGRESTPPASSTNSATLGALLLASALSLAGLSQPSSPSRPVPEANSARWERATRNSLQPMALLSMLGIGGTAVQRKRRSVTRRYRRR